MGGEYLNFSQRHLPTPLGVRYLNTFQMLCTSMTWLCPGHIWCISVHAPLRAPMSVFGHPLRSADKTCLNRHTFAGSCNLTRTCAMWHQRLEKFDNALPIKSHIVDSGSKCESCQASVFDSYSHYYTSYFEMDEDK